MKVPHKMDNYPKKQLYNDGGRIVVAQDRLIQPQSESKPWLIPIGRAVKVATDVGRLRAKGGFPEFDDLGGDDEGPSNPNSKSGGNGKGNGESGRGNKRRGNNSNGGQSGSSGGSNFSRGYQQVSGGTCLLFNSGVRSGLTVNTRIVSRDYSSMFLSSGWLFKVTDTTADQNSKFNSQLNNIIYPLIEGVISNRIQRYAGRYINVADFNKYIDALIEALQLYYCIDNILAYGTNVSLDNVNVGMERLRSQLSAEAIVEYNLIKEILCTCSCPTNLLDYIRFMCQSYRTSDAPHAPIIKLNIGGMFDENWIEGTNVRIATMLRISRNTLVSTNKMVSYLNQAFPEWLIGNLPLSADIACFNTEFMTFWHNQNCCYLSTDKKDNNIKFKYTQEVKDLDEYIDYQIIQKDSEVDGVIFISNTYFVPEVIKNPTTIYHGVWMPLARTAGKDIKSGDTRESFNIKCLDEHGRFSAVVNDINLGNVGIHNLVTYSGAQGNRVATNTQFGTLGFVKLQNVSVRMQQEAFNNAMRFWMT